MRSVTLRIFGIIVALVGAYLTYISAHQAPIVLACYGGGAVLAILCMILLWHKPAVASPLAAIFVIAGVVAQMIVVPKSTTQTVANSLVNPIAQASQAAGATPASSPPAAPATAGSEVAFGNANASPSGLPSMQPASGVLSAPQPGGDYADFIGNGDIDEGMPTINFAQGATHALNEVAAAFNPQATPVPGLYSPTAQKLIDQAARVPESAYSVRILAATLPSDPIAIYRLVRDGIVIDPYDGIMRGPIGTWLSGAGSPSDKLSLLAYLLVKKGVPLQFVRGTLSSDEQSRIIGAAAGQAHLSKPEPNVSGTPDLDPALNAYVRDGNVFAQWSTGQLASSRIIVGNSSAPKISTKHYWIQIARDGKVFDLDPTLSDMTEGQHLGTIDASFKPWAMLPIDEYHFIRILLTATFADGTKQQILQSISSTANVCYEPIRLAITPSTGSNLSDIATARKLDALLIGGSRSMAPKTSFDLDAHGGVQKLTLEIDRKDTDGHTTSSTRDFFGPGTPRQAQGPAAAGLTSILVVPGLAANASTYHAVVRAFASLENSVETANGNKMKIGPVYPIALAEYFARDEAVAEKLAEGTNGRFFRDRPDIALERSWYRVYRGTPRATLGFDIVDNGMGQVGMNGTNAIAANLSRGYADTRIETDVIHGNASYSTVGVFDAASKNEVKTAVLTGGENPPGNAGPLANGLDQTFAQGHVAIVPTHTVSIENRHAFGWWDIDPSTGNAVGRTTGGAGFAEMPEEGVMLSTVSSLMTAGEGVEAIAECASEADKCATALCEAGSSSFMLVHTLKHAWHVHSMAGFASAIAVDAGVMTLSMFVCHTGTGTHDEGGRGGGGGHGGDPPDNGPPYCQEPTQCQ